VIELSYEALPIVRADGSFAYPDGATSTATMSVRYGAPVRGVREAELYYRGDRPVVGGTVDGVELPAMSDETETIYADEFPIRFGDERLEVELELSRSIVQFLELAKAELQSAGTQAPQGSDARLSAAYADLGIDACRAAELMTYRPQYGLSRMVEAWWRLRAALAAR
jgi:hypothetical protein